MNFSLFDYLCCSKPAPMVMFQHTRVEFTGTSAYMDLFCHMERTVIMDQDYLSVSHHFNKLSKKIPIMRDIGNVSGVARVTFPNEAGIYTINYIRREDKRDIILGQISISVILAKDAQNTFDTENYSPKFLSTYQTHFTQFGTKSFEKTWQSQVESTESIDSSKVQFMRGSQ